MAIWTLFFPESIFAISTTKNMFTIEGVNADLSHYILTLARSNRCFPRKLKNLQAVLLVFVRTYNRFGIAKARFRSINSRRRFPFSLFRFF